MGGSQTNAIELAAELRGLGVECAVFGRPGTLNARIDELGLRFVESVDPGRRPSPAVVRQLRELVETEGFDIVHGYEWPPTLEGVLALRGVPGKAVVSTVMSMAVAPFIPHWVPLVVGTQQIAATEKAARRPRVDLLEPPVDLRHNVAPEPATLAAAPVAAIAELGIIRARAGAIGAIAQSWPALAGLLQPRADPALLIERLCLLPGIGPWTGHYIAMRALGWPDAFPPNDVAVLKAMGQLFGTTSQREAQARAQAWQPWRSYAVLRLWNTLGKTT